MASFYFREATGVFFCVLFVVCDFAKFSCAFLSVRSGWGVERVAQELCVRAASTNRVYAVWAENCPLVSCFDDRDIHPVVTPV